MTAVKECMFTVHTFFLKNIFGIFPFTVKEEMSGFCFKNLLHILSWISGLLISGVVPKII